MRLADWVKQQPYGEMARLARETGLKFATILYLVQGDPFRVPRYANAKKISDATGGMVSVEELCEPPPPKKKKRKRATAR